MSEDDVVLEEATEVRLERTLASLAPMKMDQLRGAWRRFLGTEPPSLRSPLVLRAELGWALQARVFGDLDAKTKRQLAMLARRAATNTVKEAPLSRLHPGTILVREWRGREYRVDILESGFRLEGEHFKSLSAVACRIAGSRWSGPRFFGLLEDQPAKMGGKAR